MTHQIHEQVLNQLEHLKSLVDAEKRLEEKCSVWGIPYTPSNRKQEDIELYEDYKREIERNGDKNLLIVARLKGDYSYGLDRAITYAFARRYVYDDCLVHRFAGGGELLLREDQVKKVMC